MFPPQETSQISDLSAAPATLTTPTASKKKQPAKEQDSSHHKVLLTKKAPTTFERNFMLNINMVEPKEMRILTILPLK